MLFSPLKPMLATMGMEDFDDDGYIFEPKWDGWRIVLHKQGDRMEAYTRNGRMVTSQFPELREAAGSIKPMSAILDCEGVCIRDGRTVFDDFAFRGRLTDPKKIAAAARTHPVSFMAFDVLMTDREHLNEPLMARKARLNEIVTSTENIALTAFIEGQSAPRMDDRTQPGRHRRQTENVGLQTGRNDDGLDQNQ